MKAKKPKIRMLGNVPFRPDVLRAIYPAISRIDRKTSELEESGEITRLKKGLYVVNPDESGIPLVQPLLANHIYGPSYVSMESALRYYGLIPESVYSTISITTGIARTYDNKIGIFRYIHCDSPYYPVGITQGLEEGVTFLIATPEKALCDQIIFTRGLNIRYQSEMERYLEDDLRFDIDSIKNFNVGILMECAATGKKQTSIKQLIKFVEHVRTI